MSSKNVHDSGSQVLQSNAGWSTKLEVDKQARFQKQVSRGNRLVEGVQLVQLPSLGNLPRLRNWRGAKKELQKHWSLHWKSAIYNYRGLLIIVEKKVPKLLNE